MAYPIGSQQRMICERIAHLGPMSINDFARMDPSKPRRQLEDSINRLCAREFLDFDDDLFFLARDESGQPRFREVRTSSAGDA